MTNAELNFRLQVCAEAGMPYSDKLWSMLAAAWDRGWAARDELGPFVSRNPFRCAPAIEPMGPGLGDVDPF